MLPDFALRFADAFVVDAATGTDPTGTGRVLVPTPSASAADLVKALDPGEGAPLYARLRVLASATGTGICQFSVLAGNVAGSLVTGSPAALGGSYPLLDATHLVANREIYIALAPISNPELPVVQTIAGISEYVPSVAVAANMGRRYVFGVFIFNTGATLKFTAQCDIVKTVGTYAKTYSKSFTTGIA